MTPELRPRRPRAVAASIVILAALISVQAAPDQATFRPDGQFRVEVNDEYPPDARFFAGLTTARARKYLVDIPSLGRCFMIDSKSRYVVAVPRATFQPGPEGAVVVTVPDAVGTEAFQYPKGGAFWHFKVGETEVRVLQVMAAGSGAEPSGARPSSAPATPSADAGRGAVERPRSGGAPARGAGPKDDPAPTATDATAKACLALERRAVPFGVAGCTNFVHLRNTCQVPVVVAIRKTEHLQSGTLRQTFPVVVPAGTEQSLGCAWWSAAMAPSDYELLNAGFGAAPGGVEGGS